jgi:hypothetical protein
LTFFGAGKQTEGVVYDHKTAQKELQFEAWSWELFKLLEFFYCFLPHGHVCFIHLFVWNAEISRCDPLSKLLLLRLEFCFFTTHS